MAKKTGEKYQAIIDAAVRVIARHGYHNAKVSLIAREAGVADGTIYLYFKKKDDILISLFSEKMGQFIEECRERINSCTSAEEKLYVLIQSHLSQLAQDPDLAVVTQIELRQLKPEMREAIGNVLKQYLNLIDSVIVDGIEGGVFRQGIHVPTARRMIFGTLDEAVTSWVMKHFKYDLTSLAAPIHNLFLYGLAQKS